jgi:hypothetical protein
MPGSITNSVKDNESNKFVLRSDNQVASAVEIGFDVSNPLPVASSSLNFSTILDEASASVSYVGNAAIGSLTSAASWQIKKIETIGTELIITWADGNANFDNVWDDRATKVYS